ncbi:hypothetical protein [Teredinibacter turnerae]|uniref:hypothetical protein n=1 Tax=Teredinibacter turnerae TaxID=2426 RepID=UPI00036B89C1|nr:hypothetical protein [Teredinibacter turnerae]
MISRRKLLMLAAYGAATSVTPSMVRGNDQVDFEWKTKAEGWLRLMLPDDSFGVGGNCPEVWSILNAYFSDPAFKEGFLNGLRALDQLPFPENQNSLSSLMAAGKPVSAFLNAFFEITIEAYYGSARGWADLQIDNAPQPKGFYTLITSA